MFKQAKKNRVFQDVIDQIEEAILHGKLSEGDRLPPERELTELFGASRGTIREALRVLEEKGFITVKTGTAGGAIISIVPPQKVTESLARVVRTQKVSMKDIADFREGVEGIVSFKAAEQADRKDLTHLRRLLEAMERCIEAGIQRWKEFIELDNDFHRYLGTIAGNLLYELVLDSVHENISRYYDRLLEPKKETMEENYRDLQDIYHAVAEKNPERARIKIMDHVRRFSLYMAEKE